MSEERNKIPLPTPRLDSDHSIEKALLNRRSVREYSDEALSKSELGQLLWACLGISKVETRKRGDGTEVQIQFRTTPSAGALNPLEVYVLVKRVEGMEPGIYHYLPGPGKNEHALGQLQKGERAKDLADAALGQSVITDAAVNIIIAGVVERTAVKYGHRARRYVLIEVGHAAENVCLQAQSLGIGVVMIGAFADDEVRELVGEETEPFYILSVGKKR